MAWTHEERYQRMCAGKWPFDTVEEAEADAKRRCSGKYPLNGYRCDYCAYAHVGHMPSWVRRVGVA